MGERSARGGHRLARDYVPEEARLWAGGAEQRRAPRREGPEAGGRCAATGQGSGWSRCSGSAEAASCSDGKAEGVHRSASGGERGESIALPSEETGLAQRPSPCRYRMHFFFLLGQGREVSVSKGRVPAQRGSAGLAAALQRCGDTARRRPRTGARQHRHGRRRRASNSTTQNAIIKMKTAEKKNPPQNNNYQIYEMKIIIQK